MDSKSFRRVLWLWPIGVIYNYTTFFFGDPRFLGTSEIVFNIIAAILIVLSIAAIVWRRNIELNTWIGAFAVGHSAGATLTAFIHNNVNEALFASTLRLAWDGPIIFAWVYVLNKIIIREELQLWHPRK